MPDDVPPKKTPEEQPASESSDSAKTSGDGGPESAPPPPAEAAAPPPPAPDPIPATPPPAAPAPQSQNRTLMLVLSYLGLLALIPLLVEKDDAEVQWHAKNGLVWTAAWIAAWIVLTVVGTVVPVLGWILGCFGNLALIVGGLVVFVMGIMKALNGERMRLPILSDYADQWK